MERFSIQKTYMKVAEYILKYRYPAVIISLVFIAFMAYGLKFLEFSSNDRDFFNKNDPKLKALEAVENTYTKDNNLFFVISPKEGDVFTGRTLNAIDELTRSLWEVPYSSRVDSIANFQHTRAEEDDLIVEDLVQNAEDLTDEDLIRIKNVALAEPALINYLISSDGKVAGINVMILLPEKSIHEISEAAKFARVKAEAFKEKYSELNLYLTGGVMFGNAFTEASQNDMMTLIPLMFVIIVAIIFLSLRSLSGTFATVLIVIFSAVTSMGIAGWSGIIITSASAIAPTIILTLAIADSIHILNIMFQHMRMGKTKKKAILESLHINMEPVFLTSITTAIGFLSMNASDAPPFHDLGNIVAVGVVAAYLFSILLLPALIFILPVKVKPLREGESSFMDKFGEFVVRTQKPLFIGTAVLLVVLAAGLSRIELDDNFLHYFGDRFEFKRDSVFAAEHLVGMSVIVFDLSAGEEGGVNNPEYLNVVEKFADWYKEQPNVRHVSTLADTMKRLNKSMHADDPAYYRIPEDRELAAQYLMLYEMSLPFGMDMNNTIDINKSSTRLSVWLENVSSGELRVLGNKGNKWLKDNAPSYMHTEETGLALLFAFLSGQNIRSMLFGTGIALFLISGILIFALRSFKIGLVSLLPNLIPAVMAFGLWGWTMQRVNLGVSVIAAMSLGLVVDDTIHFLSKYLYAKRHLGKSPSDAVRYTFNTVGGALFKTSIILASGFFVLSFSGFKVNAYMGLLTAIAIIFALIADFLFLPPLLLKIDGDK